MQWDVQYISCCLNACAVLDEMAQDEIPAVSEAKSW